MKEKIKQILNSTQYTETGLKDLNQTLSMTLNDAMNKVRMHTGLHGMDIESMKQKLLQDFPVLKEANPETLNKLLEDAKMKAESERQKMQPQAESMRRDLESRAQRMQPQAESMRRDLESRTQEMQGMSQGMAQDMQSQMAPRVDETRERLTETIRQLEESKKRAMNDPNMRDQYNKSIDSFISKLNSQRI